MKEQLSSHTDRPIELRNEEIDEILGKAPNSILRWGIAIVLLVILLLLGVSWFIHYPDALKAEITLYSDKMPVRLSAKVNGEIIRVFVNSEQEVKAGCPILLLENPASYQDVIALEALLDSIILHYQNNTISLFQYTIQQVWVLGDLQQSYAAFDKTFKDYLRFYTLGFYSQKLQSYKQEKIMTHLYYNRLYLQRNLLENDLLLASKEYNRDSVLYKNDVIATADFEKKQSAFIQKKYNFEGSRTILAATQIQMAQLDQQILTLQLQMEEQIQQLQQSFQQSITTLSNQLAIWKQTYVLSAPVDGKVVFTRFWSVHQQVTAGDQVVSVVPQGKGEISGRLLLPLSGAGKVKPNQKVLIRLSDFPYMEYGLVEGVVATVSPVPDDKSWVLLIKMPNGLHTNYHKTLGFKSGMTGQAEIITEDIRLLERFFNPIKALIKGKGDL